MQKSQNLLGKTYGRLKVTGLSSKTGKRGKRYWFCVCSCQKLVEVRATSLATGNTKSCGCLAVDTATTHGKTNHELYSIWSCIQTRCYNRKRVQYKDYGGRGIICEWKNIDEFISDMYSSYKAHVEQYGSKNTSIERIDVNRNYCRTNCRWATKQEQALNTRRNRVLELNGVKRTMREWSEVIGINYFTLSSRINLKKWDVEKALTTPLLRKA